MTPQELERLGIAITGTTNWIASLANVMGLSSPSVVHTWWTGKTKITVPRQCELYLLAGEPEPPPVPIFDDTRRRLTWIRAMLEQGHTFESIGQELGISRQAVSDMTRRYRLVKPIAELGELKCTLCSVTFRPLSRTHKCCSARCGYRSRRLLNRAANPILPKPCDECETMFQPKTRRGRFCCQRCRNTNNSRAYQRRRRARAAA
jgi:hypothetical protein